MVVAPECEDCRVASFMEAEASLLQVLGGGNSFTDGVCRDEGDICEASIIKRGLRSCVWLLSIEDALMGGVIIFPDEFCSI